MNERKMNFDRKKCICYLGKAKEVERPAVPWWKDRVGWEERKVRLCDGTVDQNAKIQFQNEDCIVYQINNEDGELMITEYQVFSGIWLCYKDAHTERFTYPASYPPGLLEITHCRKGRYEYDAGEQFFYLSGGDLSACRSREEGAVVYCPTRHYHGISVLIDLKRVPHCLSCFLEDVTVDPAALLEKLCGKDGYFIMRSTDRLEHVFSELYCVPPDMRKGYFKVKVLELLMFLNSLGASCSQTEKRSCSREQAELAKRVCQYMNAHMDTRLTIDELARHFFVSAACLRKCFYSVYGESVYAYIRAYKMRSAAHRLVTTQETVSEIAGAFGYDNCSKFAKAFRDVMGESPTEYRQKQEYHFGA